MSVLSKIIARILPRSINTAIKTFKILEFEYAHFNSARKWSCIDREGNPIPWYTYPAIEYINQLDFSEKLVFEYGSGNSTLFWSAISKKVISIENDQHWYDRTAARIDGKTELKLIVDKTAYINEIERHPDLDVIIIDGAYRNECAHKAVNKLSSGGMIILDNSDWFVNAADLLRNAGFLEVDMTGFGPINPYTWTTSFFFSREFNFPGRGLAQPQHGIGSRKQYRE